MRDAEPTTEKESRTMTESPNENKKQIDPEEQERYETALRHAREGDPAAQLEAGKLLYDGVGVKRNRGEAARWFEKGFNGFKKKAETGDADAIYQLALCYADGTGVFRDDHQAERLYRKAAELGHFLAPYCLGLRYDWHCGGERSDRAQALSWYRIGAERGDPRAQVRLAFCCETGSGCPQDLTRARMWYMKAAEQGDVSAMIHAADLLLDGRGGEKNVSEGLRLLRRAAEEEEGGQEALLRLGLFYFRGEDVPAEDRPRADELAFQWLERAAAQSDGKAYAPLGRLYLEGRGMEKDVPRGFSLVLDGAFEGDPYAQVLLGHLYEEGLGTEPSREKALEWWKYAAHNGSAEAQSLLKERGFSEKDWAEPPHLSDEDDAEEDGGEDNEDENGTF